MNVRLTGERVVLRYEVPNENYQPTGSVVLIVHDSEISGDFVVLWRPSGWVGGDDEYDLMWKGNFEFCLQKFGDEVGSFEHDVNIDHKQAAAHA